MINFPISFQSNYEISFQGVLILPVKNLLQNAIIFFEYCFQEQVADSLEVFFIITPDQKLSQMGYYSLVMLAELEVHVEERLDGLLMLLRDQASQILEQGKINRVLKKILEFQTHSILLLYYVLGQLCIKSGKIEIIYLEHFLVFLIIYQKYSSLDEYLHKGLGVFEEKPLHLKCAWGLQTHIICYLCEQLFVNTNENTIVQEKRI